VEHAIRDYTGEIDRSQRRVRLKASAISDVFGLYHSGFEISSQNLEHWQAIRRRSGKSNSRKPEN
jgi:hypothetical protein